MEYQKILNLLDNTTDQPSKFRTKNWVEVKDNARRNYDGNSSTKFKATMSKPSFCDSSDSYILAKGTTTVT